MNIKSRNIISDNKKRLWITYAWKDNDDKDIDFIIQELDESSLEIQFDRRNLISGQRLWLQISSYIIDPNKSDTWGLVITKNSLLSEVCIEEYSYFLVRAISERG